MVHRVAPWLALGLSLSLLVVSLPSLARSYVVKGKRYYVMKQVHKGYALSGLASWYNVKSNFGTATASGERFNQNAMTAANKTLPLGTRLRVTNLRNHRSVIVRINDRGPYKPGRIIDLSEGAAKKLGYFNRGVTHVRIKVI